MRRIPSIISDVIVTGVPCVAFIGSRLLLLRSSEDCRSDRSRREAGPKPQAYKPVAIKLPQPVQDPSFAAFRKQLADIAKRKDRAALAKHVAGNFFWLTDDGKDIAQQERSGIDNLARALYLDNPDSEGWDILATFAADATGDAAPERKGVICAPGEPKLDSAAAQALGDATGTSSAFWYYPAKDGLEVPSGGPRTARSAASSACSWCGCIPTCRRPPPCTPRPCGSCCRRDSSDSSLRMRCCRCPTTCSATRRTATRGRSPASSAACRPAK